MFRVILLLCIACVLVFGYTEYEHFTARQNAIKKFDALTEEILNEVKKNGGIRDSSVTDEKFGDSLIERFYGIPADRFNSSTRDSLRSMIKEELKTDN